MFHHLCLSDFAEKERKEKIRETERKDKGNSERVMIQCSKSASSNLGIHVSFCHIFVPDLKVLYILKLGGKESGNGLRKSCDWYSPPRLTCRSEQSQDRQVSLEATWPTTHQML